MPTKLTDSAATATDKKSSGSDGGDADSSPRADDDLSLPVIDDLPPPIGEQDGEQKEASSKSHSGSKCGDVGNSPHADDDHSLPEIDDLPPPIEEDGESKSKPKDSDTSNSNSNSSSTPPIPLPPIPPGHGSPVRTPDPHDVLTGYVSGRVGLSVRHPGNIRFRKLADAHKREYLDMPRNKKSEIAARIVSKIRSLDPPGRFLKMENVEKKDVWVEIGDEKACDKAKQALREGAPEFEDNHVEDDYIDDEPPKKKKNKDSPKTQEDIADSNSKPNESINNVNTQNHAPKEKQENDKDAASKKRTPQYSKEKEEKKDSRQKTGPVAQNKSNNPKDNDMEDTLKIAAKSNNNAANNNNDKSAEPKTKKSKHSDSNAAKNNNNDAKTKKLMYNYSDLILAQAKAQQTIHQQKHRQTLKQDAVLKQQLHQDQVAQQQLLQQQLVQLQLLQRQHQTQQLQLAQQQLGLRGAVALMQPGPPPNDGMAGGAATGFSSDAATAIVDNTSRGKAKAKRVDASNDDNNDAKKKPSKSKKNHNSSDDDKSQSNVYNAVYDGVKEVVDDAKDGKVNAKVSDAKKDAAKKKRKSSDKNTQQTAQTQALQDNANLALLFGQLSGQAMNQQVVQQQLLGQHFQQQLMQQQIVQQQHLLQQQQAHQQQQLMQQHLAIQSAMSWMHSTLPERQLQATEMLDPDQEALKAVSNAICFNCLYFHGAVSREELQKIVDTYKPRYPRLTVEIIEAGLASAKDGIDAFKKFKPLRDEQQLRQAQLQEKQLAQAAFADADRDPYLETHDGILHYGPQQDPFKKRKRPKQQQKRFCSVMGCTKQVYNSGVCMRHGAKVKKCSVEGCKNQAQKKGVCVRHGSTVKLCSHEGCMNKRQIGGVCYRHGAKRKVCTVLGCTQFSIRMGVCYAHGADQYKRLCKHDGCDSALGRRKSDFCANHEPEQNRVGSADGETQNRELSESLGENEV